MVRPINLPRLREFTADGAPLAGGKLYTYAKGTTTPLASYTDATGLTANTNPVILDSEGAAEVWLTDAAYSFELRDAADVVQWTADNDPNVLPAGSTLNASAIQYTTQSGATRTLEAKFDLEVVVTDWAGVDPTGATDSSTGIQAAINYALSLSSVAGVEATKQYTKRGVGVRFPAGDYLINTGLVVNAGGITLYGDPGIGARLRTTSVSAFTMFTVGLTDDSANTAEVGFRNLNLYTATLENTNQTALDIYRTFHGHITDCVFYGWNRSIVGNRMNRWFLRGVRTWQDRAVTAAECSILLRGSASGTGGGLHMTHCELAGGGTLIPSVTSHIKIEECDGLYATSVHTRDCAQGLQIVPDGTAGKNILDSIRFTNCYFDENRTYNVLIEGTLAVGGRFQQISFVQCYFRGGIGGVSGSSTNNVRVRITNGGFDRDAQALAFIGCDFRTTEGTAVVIQGTDSSREEIHGVTFANCYFQDNLRVATDTISAIQAQCESISITGCTFDDETNPPVNVVSLNLSGPDSNLPAAIVTGNDFSKSNATGEVIAYTQSTAGTSVQIADNVMPGLTKRIDQDYTKTTTNATTTDLWTYVIAQGSSGNVEVEVSGTTDTGTTQAVYVFRTGFGRNAGGSRLSTGTSSWTTVYAWNPDTPGLGTIPVADLSGNTLRVRVTGAASTTIKWVAHVKLSGTR